MQVSKENEFVASNIARPPLTWPSEVSNWVKEEYAKADVILEYGCGGSTAMAADMPDKTIFSVESSRVFSKALRAFFEQSQPPSLPLVHHVNIGPTKKWGSPTDNSGFRRYHLYPMRVWDLPEFKHPDVILVDGRFRVACVFTAMMRCTRETTLLFDDYDHRTSYREVEDFLERQETRGNMARFTVKPHQFAPEDLTRVLGYFARHM